MAKRGRPSDLVLFVSVDFFRDPKVQALTPAERLQWLEILTEQLRTGNGAELPSHAYGCSRRRVQRFREVGLLDEVEGSLHVHKWDEWNGREAYKRFLTRERVRRFRRKRDGDL